MREVILVEEGLVQECVIAPLPVFSCAFSSVPQRAGRSLFGAVSSLSGCKDAVDSCSQKFSLTEVTQTSTCAHEDLTEEPPHHTHADQDSVLAQALSSAELRNEALKLGHQGCRHALLLQAPPGVLLYDCTAK